MWSERSFEAVEIRAECAELADFLVAAGRPELIGSMIRDGVSPTKARRLLQAETKPAASTPPSAAPSRPEPYAQSSFPSEELERAAAARFSAQGAQR